MTDPNSALISALTEHEMSSEDSVLWRNRLVSAQVFSVSEAAGLSDEALSAAYRVLASMKFRSLSEVARAKEVQKRGITWSIDIPADYQQGAICY